MPLYTEERQVQTSTMKDVLGSYEYAGPFKTAVDVANHYGFHLVRPLPIPKEHKKPMSLLEQIRRQEALDFYTSELHQKINTPAFLCHTTHARRKEGLFSFDVINYNQPLAEALAIKAGMTILQKAGHQNIVVDLNPLGNTYNWNNFVEAFSDYYRTHYDKLATCCREGIKKDAFAAAHCDDEACARLYGRAPKPINFLSTDEMNHVREVLEYLEELRVPYRINHRLLHGRNEGTRLLFALNSLSGAGKELQTGFGERYQFRDEGERRDAISGVHLTLSLKGGRTEQYKEARAKKMPSVYFMHIGKEAKQKSIGVLELLEDINARVMQSIYLDTLSEQIARAKQQKVQVSLIMGVKEVREEAIIVRNMESQSQTTVGLSSLKSYLKRLLQKFRS